MQEQPRNWAEIMKFDVVVGDSHLLPCLGANIESRTEVVRSENAFLKKLVQALREQNERLFKLLGRMGMFNFTCEACCILKSLFQMIQCVFFLTSTCVSLHPTHYYLQTQEQHAMYRGDGDR